MFNRLAENGTKSRIATFLMVVAMVASVITAGAGTVTAAEGDGTLGYTITDTSANGNANYDVSVDATEIEGADSVNITRTASTDESYTDNVGLTGNVSDSFAAAEDGETTFGFEVLNASGGVIKTVTVTDVADGEGQSQDAAAPAPPEHDVRITAINASDGSAISNATVTVTDESGHSVQMETDQNAMFSLTDGNYTVTASHPDYDEPVTDASHRLVDEGYSLDFAVDGGIVSHNVYLPPADSGGDSTNETENETEYDVSFNVSDGNETAVENATIEVGNETLTTDVNGSAVVSLPDGDYDYTVSTENTSVSDTVTVNGSDKTVTVDFSSDNEPAGGGGGGGDDGFGIEAVMILGGIITVVTTILGIAAKAT